ncbi:MAG: SAP domain-containing protein [Deltaproteobacteria bacterium]|nr:SAP domain-containing protein [Deltaproteobacteria bacterium]
MKVQQIRSIAKGLGVRPARKTKAEIIRAVQEAEGNFPCFGSAMDGSCDQDVCSWREDCLKPRNPGVAG